MTYTLSQFRLRLAPRRSLRKSPFLPLVSRVSQLWTLVLLLVLTVPLFVRSHHEHQHHRHSANNDNEQHHHYNLIHVCYLDVLDCRGYWHLHLGYNFDRRHAHGCRCASSNE